MLHVGDYEELLPLMVFQLQRGRDDIIEFDSAALETHISEKRLAITRDDAYPIESTIEDSSKGSPRVYCVIRVFE